MVIARGKRPAPFRTRKLSPSAPMVLRGRLRGRVGRRRTIIREGRSRTGAAFVVVDVFERMHRMSGDRAPRPDGGSPRRDNNRPSKPRSDRSRPGPSKPGSSKPGSSRPRSPGSDPSRERSSTTRSPQVPIPDIPDDITGEELDRGTIAELRTLPEGMRETVARLLVATEACLDDDPEQALRYALAAKSKASRVAMVREAVALAAYAQGDYAQSLAEFRAVRRMTGSDEHLAMMADCERALGRPRKALELVASVPEDRLSAAARVEARLVAAGARRDLGQLDAAAVILGIPDLSSTSTDEHIGRLRYAYADILAELGRIEEARTWFAKVADTEADTDAVDRLNELRD